MSIVFTVFAVLSWDGVYSHQAGGIDHLDSFSFNPVAVVQLDPFCSVRAGGRLGGCH